MYVKPPGIFCTVTLHTLFLLRRCSWTRFGIAFSVFKRFVNVEPPRTHVIDLYTHCFLCTESSRTTSSQVDQGVYGTYTLVLGGSTAANLLQPSQTASGRGLSHAFEVVRLYRTFKKHISTRGSMCVGC